MSYFYSIKRIAWFGRYYVVPLSFKELEKYEAFVKDKTKGLMSTGAIEGTPSLILEDGTNLLDR